MATVLNAAPDAPLPDRYEVVNGVVVEVPPMSAFSSEVANRINIRLAVYSDRQGNGRPRMDMLFRLPLAEDRTRNREPDVAFISYDRWPEARPMPYRGNPMDVVPDLMVEVASPTDAGEDLLAKVYEYLRAGARLVWLVYPRLRTLYAYTVVGGPPRVFTDGDTLDGGDVLPGFSAPVAALFPALTPDEAGAGD